MKTLYSCHHISYTDKVLFIRAGTDVWVEHADIQKSMEPLFIWKKYLN
jgi:hypothetical protein